MLQNRYEELQVRFENAQTSKMEYLTKIVNAFSSLNFVAKLSIFDVSRSPRYTSEGLHASLEFARSVVKTLLNRCDDFFAKIATGFWRYVFSQKSPS